MENEHNEELPDIPHGEERMIGDVLYINPIPYTVHIHAFVEISPGVWQCSHCPQGRIGDLQAS